MGESDLPGRLIHYLSLSIPIIGISYAILTTQGEFPYNIIPVPITGGTTHFISFMLICTSFLIHYIKLSFLYPLARLVTTLTFTVFYIHLYDTIWSIQSLFMRGHGLNRISILSVIITFVILSKLDDNFGILKNSVKLPPMKTLILMIIAMIGFLGMALTGFWDDMEALDQGQTGVDPNHNPWWIFSKLPWNFLLIPYIEKMDFKAPIKLHPRVLM